MLDLHLEVEGERVGQRSWSARAQPGVHRSPHHSLMKLHWAAAWRDGSRWGTWNGQVRGYSEPSLKLDIPIGR